MLLSVWRPAELFGFGAVTETRIGSSEVMRVLLKLGVAVPCSIGNSGWVVYAITGYRMLL